MAAIKRATAMLNSPLDDPGILLQILNILGPGHHLLISAVSKAWRESYKMVDSVHIESFNDKRAPRLTITWRTSAV
jgi:hypothetical protein